MKKHERLKADLSGDLLDPNHATRRLFRCWLDGSYLGEAHYKRNLAFLREHCGQPKKLRAFVVGEFVRYSAHDAQCSTSYAQRIIQETVEPWTLEKLNAGLVSDALEFISDH